MKRIITFFLCLALMLPAFISCAGGEEKQGKIKVVCTIFPQYDWIRNIIKDTEGVSLSLIVQSGSDMHSYQPTVKDCAEIASADIFVQVGGQSDAWADEFISNSAKEGVQVISLLELLGDDALELSHNEHKEHAHGDECVKDEHVWLSLKNAVLFCNAVCEALCRADPDNAEKYRDNNSTYTYALDMLNSKYEALSQSSENKFLLFADRFPFGYMTRDYGIDYYAAFEGCSAESEAGFETVLALAQALDERELDSLMILEGSDDKLARTVIENSSRKNCKIIVLNSMQSVSRADIDNGQTYLKIMESNYHALEGALK